MLKILAAPLRQFALAFILLAAAGGAHAQATRTWVSGVGDDVNPCSRTAPCKTYAGAISKTARGGIISTLDPAGYGTVTITKSITIEGTGTNGSILSSGVNGVVINITDPTDTSRTVVLREIEIDGNGTTLGTNGVRILSATNVLLHDVRISDVSGNGIDVATAANVRVVASDVVIHRALGAAVSVAPTAGTARVDLNRLVTDGGARGVWVKTRGSAVIRDSIISGATTVGVEALSTSGSPATIFLAGSTVSSNANGVLTNGALSNVTLGGNVITSNVDKGLWNVGGLFTTLQDNAIYGNGNDTIPPVSVVVPR